MEPRGLKRVNRCADFVTRGSLACSSFVVRCEVPRSVTGARARTECATSHRADARCCTVRWSRRPPAGRPVPAPPRASRPVRGRVCGPASLRARRPVARSRCRHRPCAPTCRPVARCPQSAVRSPLPAAAPTAAPTAAAHCPRKRQCAAERSRRSVALADRPRRQPADVSLSQVGPPPVRPRCASGRSVSCPRRLRRRLLPPRPRDRACSRGAPAHCRARRSGARASGR